MPLGLPFPIDAAFALRKKCRFSWVLAWAARLAAVPWESLVDHPTFTTKPLSPATDKGFLRAQGFATLGKKYPAKFAACSVVF